MSLKAPGLGLVGIAAIAFAYIVIKLMLLFRSSASVGFDLPGIWRMWAVWIIVWIILWCVALVAGLWMIVSSRPAH
jgi:multisubunit Na+/H+ antiporter MnhB subunit